ncbi:hypothetical protein CEXT_358151 [Caerostris extrusa]|uniref:Uncharacterized protein n=1 Tax=Caerostris extrusa TaxID=172846 RepID=A0AAV4VNU4_CAEEX|nr:hypothetical protein CEXT_358151 [Caerostris extrusa]
MNRILKRIKTTKRISDSGLVNGRNSSVGVLLHNPCPSVRRLFQCQGEGRVGIERIVIANFSRQSYCLNCDEVGGVIMT